VTTSTTGSTPTSTRRRGGGWRFPNRFDPHAVVEHSSCLRARPRRQRRPRLLRGHIGEPSRRSGPWRHDPVSSMAGGCPSVTLDPAVARPHRLASRSIPTRRSRTASPATADAFEPRATPRQPASDEARSIVSGSNTWLISRRWRGTTPLTCPVHLLVGRGATLGAMTGGVPRRTARAGRTGGLRGEATSPGVGGESAPSRSAARRRPGISRTVEVRESLMHPWND